MANVQTVFVSATTKALRSFREAVRDELLKLIPSRHPIAQQDFPQHEDAVLVHEKLKQLIEKADAVICLVGPAYGGEPSEALPGAPRQSYTQMEYRIAKALGKPVFLFVPDQTAVLDPFDPESADVAALQEKFRTELTTANTDYGTFSDEKHLREMLHRIHLPKPLTDNYIHNLPYPSLGSLFKGREGFMCDLRETLTGGVKRAAAIVQGKCAVGKKTAAVHALGGIGKTRAAVEYAWQHKHDYDALLFVSAPTPVQLEAGIAALCGPLVLNLPEQNAIEQKQQYEAAIRWLRDHSRWFLILDNVDSDEALSAVTHLLTHLSSGDVCITSRLSNWPGSIVPLDLSVLSAEAGADFLLERTQGKRTVASEDHTLARDLSLRLDGLALALEQAGAYIGKLHLGFRDYLQQLETSNQKLLQWNDPKLTQYPKSLATTWLTTFDKLSAAERDLLNVLAWFDAEPIPLWLIGKVERGSDSAALEVGNELEPRFTDDIRDLLAGLADWHLVTFSEDGQSIRLHRLVQEVTLLHLTDKKMRDQSLAQALSWPRKAYLELGEVEDSCAWPRRRSLAPHALCLAHHSEAHGIWQDAILWSDRIATFYRYRGQYAQALPLFRHALELAETRFPTDLAAQSASLNNLSIMLEALGRKGEAILLARRALELAETVFGLDNPVVAIRLNNLAGLLRQDERLEEAERFHRRALVINEKVHGPEDPAVACDLSNLAVVLFTMNRFNEAEGMFRRALKINEKAYGSSHIQLTEILSNLACLLRDTNRPSEAVPLYCRALRILETTHGPDHPEIAVVQTHLVACLVTLRRGAEALALIQRAVDIFRRHGEQHGYVHPELSAAQSWLHRLREAWERRK